MTGGVASEGGGMTSVPGKLQSLNEVTPADIVAQSVGLAKPPFMETRFPVSLDEFRDLSRAAQQADASALSAERDDGLVEDSMTQVAVHSVADPLSADDPPEDQPASDGRAAPATTHTFEATPATAFRPPDCTLAVGPSDVLVAVNVDLAGFRKDGTLRFRWPSMTALFASVLPTGAGLFDPQLVYDHYAGRWVLAIAARRQSPAGSWIMLAVTQGSDPGGAWWVWALDFAVDGTTPSNNWADYPMLGFDTQALYLTTNQFAIGGGFSYTKLRTLNKSEAYAGTALRWYDHWNLRNPDNSVAFTVQSAKHFRGAGGNPAAYFCNALWPSGSTLTLWQLDDPLAHWRGAVPTLRSHRVPCRAYDLPPDAEQLGSNTRVETNDSRLLNAVYQNAGGTQRLWTAQTSKITWSGESVARSAVQWYEIDTTTRQVAQQGAFGASGFYYYFPVIQTDAARNAFIGFSRSSAQEHACFRQSGRRVTDPVNSIQGSTLVKAGESAYTGGRWGDYFGHSRDGGDASRVWLYGEFADARDSWGTWVCGTRF